MGLLMKTGHLSSMSTFISNSATFLVALSTFIVYTLSGNELTPEKVSLCSFK